MLETRWPLDGVPKAVGARASYVASIGFIAAATYVNLCICVVATKDFGFAKCENAFLHVAS